jgi:saccharopine dehydrogenase-like NADP-dependent oxidoreductase
VRRAKAAGVTIMNEIGLDPGIDHLTAMRTIDHVHQEGGKVGEINLELNFEKRLKLSDDRNSSW